MPYPEGIPEETYSGINLYIWLAAIVIHFISAVVVSRRASETKEVQSLRALLFSYAWFVLVLGINRIFFVWAYLSPVEAHYSLLLGIGYICASIAFAPCIMILEKYFVKKTKKIFSFFSLVIVGFSVVSVFLPDTLLTIRTTIQLMSIGVSIIWFMIYFWIIKSTTEAPRKKAINLVLSLLLAVSAFTLDSEFMISTGLIPLIVAPILYLIGIAGFTIILMQK
jgi:hypothetical protein